MRFYETRAVEPTPALPDRWPFAFSPDGQSLLLTHRTPRPWALVMANELGASTIVGNDGEVYSAVGNARHNGLTPFRFESATTTLPGQIVYVRDIDAGETDALGFAPFQREDAEYAVTYEPGIAHLSKRRGDLAMDCDVFVPTDYPGDMRLVTLRNLGRRHLSLRVAPFFDIALDEGANESLGKLKSETVGATLLFENPRNDFQRGTAFAATSLANSATETVRARFFGGPERDIHTPALVETGRADGSQRDDGRRVAAFAAEIELAPGAEAKIAIVFGQARDRASALAAAAAAEVTTVERELAATRAAWAERLGRIEVKTNRPDFDRLVNTWLPYQLYASRLFGRVGPNQRGGAIGFRDQLQDVLPLILTEPRLARAQIVLHAGQQFPEGDVLKWWHRAPGGGTGVAQRTRASDPHLWLPYVLARYVRQTGDAGVLDELAAYLEGPAVPAGQDTALVMSRPSREVGDVYQHARRAIEYTLLRRGENGLPLLEAGDWNDGIDGLGGKGRGTSVWMGFFFYNILDGFIPIARLKGDEAFVETCAAAREDVRVALESAMVGRSLRARLRRRRPRRRRRQCDDDRLGRLFGRARIPARADRARGRSQRDRAAKSRAAHRRAVLRAQSALSWPHRRLSAGRARERRPIQPWRKLDRRRFRQARRRGARQRRRSCGAQAHGARLRDLREDFAAEEDRSRSHRDLRVDPDPAAGRHL